MRSTTAPTKAVPATADLLGFVLREITAAGPTTEQRAGIWGKELELPWKAGAECTLEPPPDAFEVEGDSYLLLSGTGAIDDTTARGTELGFVDGKIRVAQSGDTVKYVVGDNSGLASTQLTAEGDGPRLYVETVS